MKNPNILYVSAFLLSFVLFINGCKKDSSSVKKTTSLDSASVTVSTVTNGYYDFITADLNGNIYALHKGGADSIYKIDASGNKKFFYTVSPEMVNDTVVTHRLGCIATDSVGNVYTINYRMSAPSLIKITPSGSASVVFDSSIIGDGQSAEKIAVSQGNYYFSDNLGIHKVTPAGVASVIIDPKGPVFTVNRNGVVYYADYFDSNDDANVTRINANGTTTIIAGAGKPGTGTSQNSLFSSIVDLTTDKTGNIYVSEGDDTKATIHIITPAGTVTQLISTPFAHADGPITTAKIGVAFSLAADASNDLYFSELTVNPNDIRKIALH